MNIILTTLVAGSIIFVGGCNKTKKATATNTVTQTTDTIETASDSDIGQIEMEFNVEVESDGEQIVLNINGEEQVIDIGDMARFHGMDDDGEMMVAITKMITNTDGSPMQWMHDGDSNVDFQVIVNGEEVRGDSLSMQEHIMKMVNDGGPMDPREMREHMGGVWVVGGPDGFGEMRGHPMMTMMGGEGHDGMMRMHDQMIEMMGDREMPDEMREIHEQMMQMHEMQERRPEHMRDDRRPHYIPEEHEFMQELGMLDEMSYHLSELGAISLLGIHMIRDELEPEARMEALERIIDETPNPSPARNAALIVAIETLRELEMNEEATDMMVELVISNARWDDDD